MSPLNSAKDASPSREEIYQAFLRSLKRRKGFGIVFVQSPPAEAKRIIEQVQQDLPEKQIAVLKLTEPISNLYDLVENRPDRKELNILFIQGLEESLKSYVKPGYGGEGDYYNLDTVPTILSHLNQRREIFRDRFRNICFVFVLPAFAIKYIIRRAPDFFDWGAGVFDFSTDEVEVLATKDRSVSIGDYQPTIELLRQSLAIRREIGDRAGEAHSLGNLGNAYYSLGEYQQAIELLQQSLAIRREIGDRAGEASCLGNLGNAYYSLGEYQQAIELLEQSLAIRREIGDRAGEANSLRKLGLIYHSLKQYEESLYFYDEAITIDQELDRVLFVQILLYTGDDLQKIGRLEEAINSYSKALEIDPTLYEAWFQRGKSLDQLGQLEEAIANFDKALAIKPDLYEALYYKASCYSRLGNAKLAIENLKRAIEISPKDVREWAKTNPAFKAIQRDKQFQELIWSSVKKVVPNGYGD